MLAKLKRSRLALRIYLIGLAQISVVLAGLFIIIKFERPPPPRELHAEERGLARAIERNIGDSDALDAHLRAVRDNSGLEATVVDPAGNVLATTVAEGAPPCVRHPSPPSHENPPRRPPLHERHPPKPPGDKRPVCYTIAIPHEAGGMAHIEFRRVLPSPPSPFDPSLIAFVLVVVAISSIVLSRSLARPLQKLATAANALGGGDLTARAAVDRSDELGEVARTFNDMADRVSELLRAEKELVANVSHELRTPLARIRVALDIAAEGDAATVQESLADIADDLAELEGLINDVLIAARLDLAIDAPRGIPPLRQSELQVAELLSQATARFRSAHPERPLEIEVAAGLPPLRGDRILLRRVFENLLENAHKYTEDGAAPITLKARLAADVAIVDNADAASSADAGEVVIEVHDRGIGIAAKDLGLIFRPFFRVDRSRTRATGGLGLGLALAKRIIDAHGGTISLRSEPKMGTVASVRLSLQKPLAASSEVIDR